MSREIKFRCWKTNVDDISYMYVNPDVTKAFKMLDGEEVDNV